jgi:hypothetical protein
MANRPAPASIPPEQLLRAQFAAAGRIPSFRIGSCVRFDPRAVAKWLRQM